MWVWNLTGTQPALHKHLPGCRASQSNRPKCDSTELFAKYWEPRL